MVIILLVMILFFPSLVKNYRAYIFTERPLYLPGEKVFFKGILRQWTPSGYKVPAIKEKSISYKVITPRGKTFHKGVAKLNKNGSFASKFPLSKTLSLGKCILEAKFERYAFQTEFQVEKFTKPKFIVLVKPKNKALVMRNKASYDIMARYYSGGKVEKGIVGYRLYRSRFYQPLFKNTELEGFYSSGEYKSFKSELVKTGRGTLKKGHMQLTFDTPKSNYSYYYRLQAVVVDKSRNVASGSASIEVSQASIKVDLKANKDMYAIEDQITVKVKAETIQGLPVSCKFTLDFYRKGRTYPKGGSALFPWDTEGYQLEKDVPTVKFATLNGKTDKNGTVIMETPATMSGEIDIKLTSTDKDGNTIEVEKTVWVSAGTEPVLYSGNSIKIIPDKRAYEVGDTANIMLILPMKNVSPLITLEGAKIWDYKVVKLPSNSYLLKVKIKEHMVPNMYVRVSAIYRNGFVESEQMIVIPPIQKMLKITITPDRKKYSPGQKALFDILVTDYNGNPVSTELSLGVVDASIYALASDKNAKLHKFFYPLQRQNIGSSSTLYFLSYDYARVSERLPKPYVKRVYKKEKKEDRRRIADSAGESLADEDSADVASEPRPEQPRETSNTGARPPSPAARRPAMENAKKKSKPKPQKQNKVSARKMLKNTASWFAFVQTDLSGRANISFSFPENLTNWKVIARAISTKTKVGEIVQKVSTRKPISLLFHHPSFLIEKDRVRLEVAARNATATSQKIGLSVKVKGNAKVETPAKLQDVASGGWIRNTVAMEAIGAGELSLYGYAKGKYSDALMKKIPILAHGIRKSTGLCGVLEQNYGKLPSSLFLLKKEEVKSAKLTVRIFPGYVAAIEDCLDMLVDYPYGCTEQTMSRFMPNLVVLKIFENLNIQTSIAPEKVDKNVKAGLIRLYQLQHKDGGWGWWAKDSSHLFMSSYVMSGLGRAIQHGYKVDKEVHQKGISFLKKQLFLSGSYAEKSYIIYALSLNNDFDAVLFKKVFHQQNILQLDSYSLSLLVLSVANAKRDQEARQLLSLLEKKAYVQDDVAYFGEKKIYKWNQNAVEVTALALRAILSVSPSHELVPMLLKWLMKQKKERGWNSTKDTSEVILTLCDYLKNSRKNRAQGEKVTIRVNQNMQKAYVKNEAATFTFYNGDLIAGLNNIAIMCDTPGELFYSAYVEFFTQELPISSSHSGLHIKRDYHILREVKQNGQIFYKKQPFPKVLTQDDFIMVTLSFELSKGYDFLMLSDALPATARIERDDRNINLLEAQEGTKWIHREFHYDKTLFFFTRLEAGKHTVRYFFKPSLSGTFHALPAVLSLMYYPEIRGNSREVIFSVK